MESLSINRKPWAQWFGTSGSNLGNGIAIVLEHTQVGGTARVSAGRF